MDDSFTRALDEWTAYFALMGGAAATLLGLLFVAVSLRLNIFHQRTVADVRDYAALTLGTFLVAIAVAGVVLAPHEQREIMALLLFAVGIAGLIGLGWVARVSIVLNRAATEPAQGALSGRWRGLHYMLFTVCPYVAVSGAALLLWNGHADALGWLAIAEGWLLISGTVIAWILLSHAGHVGDATATASEPPSSP